jgi:UDP-2,4-diacetamido-2,4,6-trideoxy-beta-L-altropyranose hydrolase
MRIAIRTDASSDIGSGHVMRCITLARLLKSEGNVVIFVCRPQAGDLIDFIKSQNMNVISLGILESYREPSHSADYIGWLQTSVRADANEFLSKIESIDVVITDHYAIGAEWHRLVRGVLSCKIIAIDDLVREHDADLVLDQTLGRKCQEYKGKARVLAGSSYALLRPNFALMREKAYLRSLPAAKKVRVLLSMGGVDKPNATMSVLLLLSKIQNLTITVLLGKRAPHYKTVVSYCAKLNNVCQLDFVEDMADLMLNHDLAVGAPGSTSWERACLGLPCIVIPLAENQFEIASKLEANNAAIVVNLHELQSKFSDGIDLIMSKWDEYVQANLSLCDGLGVYRFLIEFQHLCEPEKYRYDLVEAGRQDIKIVYSWQTDPLTRQYALNPNVPLWEQHQEWMLEKIADVTNYFYIITDIKDQNKVGVVRLDGLGQGLYLVSIYVDPSSYGKGIAQAALVVIDKLHPHITIKATVLPQNSASQRLFEKANYQRISPENFLRNPII